MFVSGLIAVSAIFTSCESIVPTNNEDFGTSFTLNSSVWENPQFKNFMRTQNPIGKTLPICVGSWDFGRNIGNTWCQDEYNSMDIKQHERMYGDSIGYISFGEGGLGELVIVNYDTLHYEIPFTYEVLGTTRQTTYIDMDFESTTIRTYVVKELSDEPPLYNFNYTYYADLVEDNKEYVIYKWEGDMSNFSGAFKWTATNISRVNSSEREFGR